LFFSVFLKIEEASFYLTVSSFLTNKAGYFNLINRPPPDIFGIYSATIRAIQVPGPIFGFICDF